MSRLQRKTRSTSNSETSRQVRSHGEAYEGEAAYKDPIEDANNTPILEILKIYGVVFQNGIKKTICPLPDHKDKTPSFLYYPDTNSFYCFGSKSGSKPVDFVSKMERVERHIAAQIILENNFSVYSDIAGSGFSNRIDTLISFSEKIRNLITIYPNRLSEIEEYTKVLDDLNVRYNLTDESTKMIINKLNEKMSQECLKL